MLTFENNSSVMISILGFRRIGVSHILLIPTCSSIPEFIHLCEIPNNGRLVKTNVLSDFRPSLDNNLDLAALLLPSHEYSASVRFSKRLVLVVMEIFAESGRWNFIKQMSASTEKCIYLSRSRNGVRANRIYEPKLFGQRNMQLLTSEVQSGATRFKQKCPNSSVSLSWDIVGTWPGTLVRQFVGQSQNKSLHVQAPYSKEMTLQQKVQSAYRALLRACRLRDRTIAFINAYYLEHFLESESTSPSERDRAITKDSDYESCNYQGT
ncbi:12806_t:CDS:2 [Funneliformis geosporum]|uniref:12806_t:CDS:1 n=1 Tax=Funneliformis geosporum TaxID=1117311 RepID=A0A9W4SR57_9GLOM|nr:12806_t:CDS:2 [Funneliformis geosporum]